MGAQPEALSFIKIDHKLSANAMVTHTWPLRSKPVSIAQAAWIARSGKWKPLILFFLAKGTMRYGEPHRCVRGVSYKVLTQQLKDLENHGVIAQVDYGEIRPRVDYSLTPLGLSVAEAMVPLCD